MNDTSIPLLIDDTFTFTCNSDVPCFNDCCRDLNQFLTPYDILRLKNALNLSSSDFLETYTITYMGQETGLPIVSLRDDLQLDKACPFVTPKGCKVYEDRPASCRTYPLARAIAKNRQTGMVQEYFMLMKEPHCRGFEKGTTFTVREWLSDQDLSLYNEENDKMMEIISLKNTTIPGELDNESAMRFYLACYDTDRFREEIFERNLLKDADVSEKVLSEARVDDLALLNLGMAWTKNTLFGIPMER